MRTRDSQCTGVRLGLVDACNRQQSTSHAWRVRHADAGGQHGEGQHALLQRWHALPTCIVWVLCKERPDQADAQSQLCAPVMPGPPHFQPLVVVHNAVSRQRATQRFHGYVSFQCTLNTTCHAAAVRGPPMATCGYQDAHSSHQCSTAPAEDRVAASNTVRMARRSRAEHLPTHLASPWMAVSHALGAWPRQRLRAAGHKPAARAFAARKPAAR